MEVVGQKEVAVVTAGAKFMISTLLLSVDVNFRWPNHKFNVVGNCSNSPAAEEAENY